MAFNGLKALYKEFMLSLSESFIDVQSMGKKNVGGNLSQWAKRKAENGGDNNGR
jgi:hypothetical protein